MGDRMPGTRFLCRPMSSLSHAETSDRNYYGADIRGIDSVVSSCFFPRPPKLGASSHPRTATVYEPNELGIKEPSDTSQSRVGEDRTDRPGLPHPEQPTRPGQRRRAVEVIPTRPAFCGRQGGPSCHWAACGGTSRSSVRKAGVAVLILQTRAQQPYR